VSEVPALALGLGVVGTAVGAALAGPARALAGAAAGAVVGMAAGYALQNLGRWLTPEGPRLIVGHTGPNEARLWGRGEPKLAYMFVAVRDASDNVVARQKVRLLPENGYTGTADVTGLKPGQPYTCEVSYGSTADAPAEERHHAETGRFRTPAPDDGEVSFFMGSCNNHRLWRRGEAWERVNATAERLQPDFMLHTGDQIYADQPLQSHTLDGFRGCYRRAWSTPEARAMLKNQANYMILDDHEVRNGFAQDEPLSMPMRAWLTGTGLWGSEKAQRRRLEEAGLQAYREFQHSHNPHTFGQDKHYYTFERGSARFFVLDTATEREPEKGELISSKQMGRLKEWLASPSEGPKFIVSSVPVLAEASQPSEESRWSSSAFRGQRDELLDFIAREGLRSVVFLSGDSHNSFHMETELQAPGGESLRVHELGASPINGWVLRGREMYRSEHEAVTAGGTAYHTELDQEHFLGGQGVFSRDYSGFMSVRASDDEVQFSIHRTHRDDPAGTFTSGSFSL